MPLFVWFIIAFALCSGLWNAFAATGISLLQPSATMGALSAVDTGLTQARAIVTAILFFTLAYGAYRRSRAALWACIGLFVLNVAGWLHVSVAAPDLPDVPTAMMVIFVIYRLSALAILVLIGIYLLRLYRKDRLA